MTPKDSEVAWAAFVRKGLAGRDNADVAGRADVSVSQLGRWARGVGGHVKADKAIGLARALGLPPKEALVAAGYLTRDEADAVIEVSELSADELPDEELIHQLTVRLAQRPKSSPYVSDITRMLTVADDSTKGMEDG